MERNGIEREGILNSILDFLASQVGSLTNPTSVANSIGSMRHEKVNSSLVSSYITHTVDAFLLRVAQRYDVKGKSYFNYPNKYYYRHWPAQCPHELPAVRSRSYYGKHYLQ